MLPIHIIGRFSSGSGASRNYYDVYKVGGVVDGYAVTMVNKTTVTFSMPTLQSMSGNIGQAGSSVTLSSGASGSYTDTVTDGSGFVWHRYHTTGTANATAFIQISPGQKIGDSILSSGVGNNYGTISGSTVTMATGASVSIADTSTTYSVIYRY